MLRRALKQEVQFFQQFFKKFLEDISPFSGATVLDFWLLLLWVSDPEWAVLFVFGVGVYMLHSS